MLADRIQNPLGAQVWDFGYATTAAGCILAKTARAISTGLVEYLGFVEEKKKDLDPAAQDVIRWAAPINIGLQPDLFEALEVGCDDVRGASPVGRDDWNWWLEFGYAAAQVKPIESAVSLFDRDLVVAGNVNRLTTRGISFKFNLPHLATRDLNLTFDPRCKATDLVAWSRVAQTYSYFDHPSWITFPILGGDPSPIVLLSHVTSLPKYKFRLPETRLVALDDLRIERRDDHAVGQFLDENPHLYFLLREARAQIDAVFGDATPLVLEVVRDPEGDADQLFLFIRTKLDAQRGGALIDRLDQDWWIDAVPKARGRLAIALAFE